MKLDKPGKNKKAGAPAGKPSPEGKKKNTPPPVNSLKIILGCIVAGVAFLLYVQTVNYSYALDDYSVIKENRITKQGTSAIPTIFKTSYRFGYNLNSDELYRPIPKALLALQWEMAPDSGSPGHWCNVLFYALLGFILFITLVKYFSGNLLLSFLTSLLFISHPIHTEVVANIKSIDEILCFLFLCLTLFFIHDYYNQSKKSVLFISLICFFLAFLCKESTITFLAVIPLALYFFCEKNTGKIARTTLWFLIPTVIFLIIRKNIIGSIGGKDAAFIDNILVSAPDALHRFATAIYILGLYLKLLIFPHPLMSDYSYNQVPFVGAGDWQFLLSFSAYIALIIIAIALFKKRHIISFAILFYFITISLFTNLVITIGTHMGERLIFIPSLGFAIVVAFLLTKLNKSKTENEKPEKISSFLKSAAFPISTCVVLIVLYSFKTIDRSKAWKDNYTLYSTDVLLSPNSARSHYYLGNLIGKEEFWKGKPEAEKNKWIEQARSELRRSLEIYPKYANAYLQLGLTYYYVKDYKSAELNFIEAIRLNPNDAVIRNNMGTVNFNTGKYKEAIDEFSHAVRLDPNYAEALCNLGCAYGTIGQYDNSINWLLKSVKADPLFVNGYYFLGVTYKLKGDPAMAELYTRKAKELNPSFKP